MSWPVLKHFAGQKVSDHTAAEGNGQISEHGNSSCMNACRLTAAWEGAIVRTADFWS